MKITALEEYGLRCILQLAGQSRSEPLTVGEISRREGLSVAYVEKLLRILGKAGLVQSARGIRGGYVLTKPCNEISVGDVGRALGGLPDSQDICHRYTGNLDTCIHENGCGILSIWQGIAQHVQEVLDNIPISKVVHRDRLTQLSTGTPGSRDRARAG